MKLKLLLFMFSLLAVFYIYSQNASAANECIQDSDCPGCQICTGMLLFKKCAPLPNEADPAVYPHVYTNPCEKISKSFCYQSIGSDSVDVWKGAQDCPYTYSYKGCTGSEWRVQDCVDSTPKCYESGGTASCVECLSNADCTSPKTCDLSSHKCVSPPPITCISCTDGTLKGACNAKGEKCDDPFNTGICTLKADSSCTSCTSDASGCTDDSGTKKNSCATARSQWQWSCSGSTCAQKEVFCSDYCNWATGGCGSGGGGSAGGCAWQYNGGMGSICSSGCPSSYPDRQYTCCETVGASECNSRPACTSYNPIIGETPCCTTGGYNTCTKQETCTATGCKNVCTDPSVPKDGEPYCSKCNSCQDTIQNCGETGVDKGGTNCGDPCTVPTVHPYTTPGSYGSNCKCQASAPSGYYNIQCISLGGCSSGEYGCWWNCQGTHDDFNTASCSDEVRNCAETCVDGGTQCNAGTKETDNTYAVSFEFSQPVGLIGTKLYNDANSWNCADGTDNDHDCLIDCADPDCSSSLACSDITPPNTAISLNPANPNSKGWYTTEVKATLTCTDDMSGCDWTKYRVNGSQHEKNL
jgi:hypothetical protein